MVVKLLRWCTSNFLEFSRDFQESPPKVSHGMLFTGRSLGRHSKLPATGCCQLSYRQESDWRMHTLQELDTGEDTQSAEPGKRSTEHQPFSVNGCRRHLSAMALPAFNQSKKQHCGWQENKSAWWCKGHMQIGSHSICFHASSMHRRQQLRAESPCSWRATLRPDDTQ